MSLRAKLLKLRRSPERFFRDSSVPFPKFVRDAFSHPATRALMLDPVETITESDIPIASGLLRAREQRLERERWQRIESAGTPLCSVIMAAHDAAETIEDAALSIRQQSYSNFELLIVNDASTDATAARIAELAATDHRVRTFDNTENRGAAMTRNVGLREAKGEFITFQDADDRSHAQRLERQLAALLANSTAMVCLCNGHREDAGGNPIAINDRRAYRAIIAMMFRRQVIDDLGYFDDLHVSEDSEYCERISAVYGDDAEIELFKTLYVQRFSPDSLLFSDGAVDVGANGVEHRRSAEADRDLEAFRARHRRIRAGEISAYVPFDA